jgi:hypothetical protein
VTNILQNLGLTKEEVVRAVGLPLAPGIGVGVVNPSRYLYGSDQQRIRRRMREYSDFIIVRYLEGWHPGTIARLLSVSEESIRGTLRKRKVFKKKKAGRPLKSASSLQGSLLKDPS